MDRAHSLLSIFLFPMLFKISVQRLLQRPIVQLRTFANTNASRSTLLQQALKDVEQSPAKLTLPTFSSGNMRVSPQKLNHLARLIRGMSLGEAKEQMSFVLKKRGVNIRMMLNRVHHALKHNYNQDSSQYFISQAWVGKGQYLKRLRMMGRGRTGRMTRPSAHLKILLKKREQTDKEMLNLVKQFKQHKLFLQLADKRPVYPLNAVWSTKQYKYLYSPKWSSPDAALKKQ